MKYDIGFLGGGQLARMSIMAAQRMGLRCLSLDPGHDAPASQVAAAVVGKLDDPEAIANLASQCDTLTWDSEFIPVAAVREGLRQSGMDPSLVTPSLETLETVQDKFLQRQAYANAGVPGPRFFEIKKISDLPQFGLPVVAKARFGGYDGKGTRTVRDESDIAEVAAFAEAEPWMAEEFVPFRRELAVMVCRSPRETLCFPTMETVQADHVCDLVFPADTDATAVAVAAVEALGGYGLFGVELFELADGSFMVNEAAPRPHNSGHYSLDWGGPSQFEQHVRLVVGLPLAPIVGRETCMANLLGQPGAVEWRDGLRAATLALPGAHVHWYGKAEAKPGRKMGHINVAGPGCVEKAIAARKAFYAAWTRS
ncbi:MAG: 5-(carboxyamino)imidazole ribonucleotide synthase [Armatimonadetes bacterium]|nr:5-(carboxyamino)imidazole ribonucleotide synthase [Armatimonadota bacterium]